MACHRVYDNPLLEAKATQFTDAYMVSDLYELSQPGSLFTKW